MSSVMLRGCGHRDRSELCEQITGALVVRSTSANVASLTWLTSTITPNAEEPPGGASGIGRAASWSQTVPPSAAAPIGAVFTAIGLMTGSIWGYTTWGTWWEWGDARLVSVLVGVPPEPAKVPEPAVAKPTSAP